MYISPNIIINVWTKWMVVWRQDFSLKVIILQYKVYNVNGVDSIKPCMPWKNRGPISFKRGLIQRKRNKIPNKHQKSGRKKVVLRGYEVVKKQRYHIYASK